MRKLFVVAGALGLIAVPAIAQADPGEHPGAVRFCESQRVSVGTTAFRERYGQDAFARCVSRHVRVGEPARRDARVDCTAERNLIGVAAFRAKYGTARRERHAFARCVRLHQAAERAADKVALQTCQAQRTQLGVTAFRASWGAGVNDRRALARCVDGLEQDSDSPTAQS